MKFHRLTLLSALFLSVTMFVVAWLFDYSKDQFTDGGFKYLGNFLIAFVIATALNYFIVDSLLGYYGKKQIRRISTILPDEIVKENEQEISFTVLGERVSELQERNAFEIDTMKEMENYRKEYLGNVSHELKTPLFSIQGYLETLLDGGVENLAIRDKYLERIDKSVERLLNIVQDLDDINQYESGEIILHVTKFDINLLIRDILDLLDLEAQKRGAKMQLQSTYPNLFVMADKQKISQVLINLISNAIYYSNREQAQIIVKTTPNNGMVTVQVEDNGMGIKEDALPRIFERFYRVEASRSRREGGSGLGLAIVKHILEAHNQKIEVKSEYLNGTVFLFKLAKATTKTDF